MAHKHKPHSSSLKIARMSNPIDTNIFLKSSSKHNRNTHSMTPKGKTDVCITDHLLSELQPSHAHLSQSDDESSEPLNSILVKKKQHHTEKDKCIIGSSDNKNCPNLSNPPPSYESIAKDNQDCAVKR